MLIKVFPNPNQGEFKIVLNLSEETNLKVRIFSTSGQRIFEDEKAVYKGVYTKQVDLTHQPTGIYFLEVKVNGETTIEKILYNRN